MQREWGGERVRETEREKKERERVREIEREKKEREREENNNEKNNIWRYKFQGKETDAIRGEEEANLVKMNYISHDIAA